MGSLIRDLRYAARGLWRAPRFTALVVVTLGIGIGANTAVFSVVDTVLLERLPYPDPDRLVTVWRDETGRGGADHTWLSLPVWRDLRDEPGLFDAAAAWSPWTPTLTGVEEPEVLEAAEVSSQMFGRVLRVRPALGRDFLPADDVEGAAPVVLLSHRAWHTRFGGDPDVVGKAVSLSDVPYTVIGVMPEGLRPPFAPEAELWRSLGASAGLLCGRACPRTGVLARLGPRVTLGRARAHASALAARLGEAFPSAQRGAGLTVSWLRDDLTRGAGRPLRFLLGVVAFVLLIACANVASLLLARGHARRRELALRMAIGAERGRIVGLLLTESLVLALPGGLLGLGLAAWGTDALLALAPPGAFPRLDGVGTSGRVLAFTAAVTVATGVLFGLLPAWRLARAGSRPAHALARRDRRRPDGLVALAVAQLAVALVLVAGAGLMLRSFRALDSVALGFEPVGVLAAEVTLPERRYPAEVDRQSYLAAVLRRLGDLPGVVAAGAARSLPLAPDDPEVALRVEDAPPPEDPTQRTVAVRPVTRGWFGAVGIELREGRTFEERDAANAERVVVVNETLARAAFPQGAAVGHRIAWEDGQGDGWRTIVGVVGDVRHLGLREPPRPAAYVPYRQVTPAAMAVAVRVEGDPLALAGELRQAVSGLDPSLAPARVRPLRTLVDDALAPDRFVAVLLSAFGVLALMLAAVGVHGVTWHGAAWRTREVAVRLALGAEPAAVMRAVVLGALGMTVVGLGLGLALSFAVGRVLARFLFGVAPLDPATVGASALLLGCVALLGAWAPASRAGRAEPMRALRPE